MRELAKLGHRVRLDPEMAGFGGGQMIWRDPETGVYIAGSESRKDGQALALESCLENYLEVVALIVQAGPENTNQTLEIAVKRAKADGLPW